MKDSLFIKKRETNNPYYSLRKLGILVFFVSVLGLNVSAMVNLSDARINLMFEDVPIKDVFSEIEKQSDHIFMFSGDLKKEISKKITVHVNSASLSEILDIVTHGTDLKYRILDKQIVIYKSDTASSIVNSTNIRQRPQESSTQRFSIGGIIKDFDNKQPVVYATIVIKELNTWATSNDKGVFNMKNVYQGDYTLEVSCMGYVTYTIPVSIRKDILNLNIQLRADNLLLEDVIVTAKSGMTINSSSILEKSSIDHLQPSSLADVMQLVPGSLTKNPDLTTSNTVTIRTIRDNKSLNASGVGLLVDGSRVSNSGEIGGSEAFDYRKISTDNIESVEVMKGVLSAQYGDMTSGAVIVKTKAGITPYEVRIKSDPRTKAASFNKGFELPSEKGFINVNADYARAFKKNISPVDIFDRITMGINYSNTFNKKNTPFRFNFKVSGNYTGNSVTQDPDVSSENFSKTSSKSLTTSMYGSWMLNKPFISVLNYNFSGDFQKQVLHEYAVVNRSQLPTTNTKKSGIAEGYFTELQNKDDYWQENVPVYFNAKVFGNLNKKFNETFFNSMFGFEYNLDGNLGKGNYYTTTPPEFFRERAYSEIPFMNNLSFFAEEKIHIPINKSSFEVVGGMRFTKMFIKGYNYAPIWEPRINARFEVMKPRVTGKLRRLDFRGGWGIMKKLPTIDYLYPAPIYTDFPLFQYMNTVTNQSLAVIQTDIIDELLPYNLKPHKTNNIEVGVDFNISGINTQITYFNEHLVDGITDNSEFFSRQIRYYNPITATYADPKYENGTVYAKDENGVYYEVPSTLRNNFKTYSRPDNRGKIKKWGLEYAVAFPRIKALNTTISLNGAYMSATNTSDGEVYLAISSNDPINPRDVFPYLAVFNNSSLANIGTKSTRFNTNVNFVTNIPAIRMVVSLTAQFVWLDESQNIFDQENSYIEDASGNAIYGDYANQNVLQDIFRDPSYYIDFQGNRHPFSDFHTTQDPELKMRLRILRRNTNTSYYFLTSGYNPYMMANIRLTKEIGNALALSFYANNFANYNPIMKNKARPYAVGRRVNSDIYFGAELKLKF